MTITLSIMNVKGGSGKTTLSSLLSLALADHNYDVIVVDRDPQAGITAMLYGSASVTENEFFWPAKV